MNPRTYLQNDRAITSCVIQNLWFLSQDFHLYFASIYSSSVISFINRKAVVQLLSIDFELIYKRFIETIA